MSYELIANGSNKKVDGCDDLPLFYFLTSHSSLLAALKKNYYICLFRNKSLTLYVKNQTISTPRLLWVAAKRIRNYRILLIINSLYSFLIRFYNSHFIIATTS